MLIYVSKIIKKKIKMIRTKYTYIATVNEYFEYCMELVALKGIEFKIKEERFRYREITPTTNWRYNHLTPEDLHTLNAEEKAVHYHEYYERVDNFKETPDLFNREDDDYYEMDDYDFECDYHYDGTLGVDMYTPVSDLDYVITESRYYRIRKMKWQRKYSAQLKDGFGIDLSFEELMGILTDVVIDYKNCATEDFNTYMASDSIKKFREICFRDQIGNVGLIDFWCNWCEGAARPIPFDRAEDYGYLPFKVENLSWEERHMCKLASGMYVYSRTTFPTMDYFVNLSSASEINRLIYQKIPRTTVRFIHSKLVLVCYTILLIIKDQTNTYTTATNKYLAIFKFIEYLFGDLELDIENFKFLTDLFFRCIQFDSQKSLEYGLQYYPHLRSEPQTSNEFVDEYGFSMEIVKLFGEYVNNNRNRFKVATRATWIKN